MANLINTIRSMNVIKEAPEDKMPASPDEGKMAYAQCEFIEYASEEICDYIENGGNFPEWFQNKLTKAHEVMKDLHSYMEGEKRASGTGQDPEEMDEAMDPVNKKALKKDFDDRKDKDIDNDGDTDDSDEYLHNRRKAVSKAIKGEGKGEKVEVNPKLDEETLEEEDHIGKMEYHERQAQKTTGAEQRKHMEKAKEHRRKAEFAMRGGSAHSYKEEVKEEVEKTPSSIRGETGDHAKKNNMKPTKHFAAQHKVVHKLRDKGHWTQSHDHADQHSVVPDGPNATKNKNAAYVRPAGPNHSHVELTKDRKQVSMKTVHHKDLVKHIDDHIKSGYKKSTNEELQIDEGLETRISGGKVPVGQHTLHYKTDKSHKYISNSIKERDPKAKITGKDGHTIVHATAQAHSSVIKSLRDFRTSGVVHDDKASNMKEETMDEGTMSRYELIKKAAQKVNKGDKKAMSDAQKAAKKDKDLRKPKVDSADVDEGANILDKVGAAIHKAVVGDKQEKPAVVTAPAKKPAPKSKMKPLMPAQHESVENASEEVITEGNAAMELKKYANSKGGIDKQDFIAIANMIAKKKSAKDLAMVLQVQDTDPRDKALEIISKNDNKLYHEILKAARGMKPAKSIKKPDPKKLMAQYEEVELEEDYKQDAKNAPFDADPEKKKKQKNSDGTETSPMSKAKQLAKKGLVSEAEMTPAQKRKKEEIVKGMKDKKDYFERKYGDRAKDVMYATATKMAMKEGFELSEETLKEFSVHTYKANQSSKKVATTKNGTNYVDGRAVGPVSDPDGGSASTPTRYSPPTKNGVSPPTQVKKEEKEIEEKVTASGTVTPSKLAARDAKNDPKSTQMGVAGAQGQGKVGMSSTSTPQPFSGTVGKKAPAGTVSPVQRLKNLLGK
jgi:hypothetical protein